MELGKNCLDRLLRRTGQCGGRKEFRDAAALVEELMS
jgi:hypothetical protein